MKFRYRLFQRNTGIFLIEDRVTGKQASLQTRDKVAAQRIFNAKNESASPPTNAAFTTLEYQNGFYVLSFKKILSVSAQIKNLPIKSDRA